MMGLLSPFSFWPLASSTNNTNTDDERKDNSNREQTHRLRGSWTLVNPDQTNVIDLESQGNSPSPTELAADVNGPERHGHRHGAPSRPKLTLDTGAIQSRRCQVERRPPGPGNASSDAGVQSRRGSRGFTGLKTRFRSRMGRDQHLQQQQFYAKSPPAPDDRGQAGSARVDPRPRMDVEDRKNQDAYDLFEDTATVRGSRYDDALEIPEMSEIPPVPPIPQLLELPQLPQLPDMSSLDDHGEDSESREFSDGDLHSRDSNMTSSTVRHCASACPVDRIPLTDRGYVYEYPFEELCGWSGTNTNVRPSMLDNGDVSSRAHPGMEKQGPPPLPEQSPLLLPQQDLTLSECLPRQTTIFRNFSDVSNSSTWSAHIDQYQAVKQFNDIAHELCLHPVTLKGEEDSSSKKPDTVSSEKPGMTPGRRNGLLRRIRTMRSNIQLRPPEPEHRRVRRMRTFASLPSRPEPFVALRGKPLEMLGRLGGYTILKLPGDFVPAPLKLPVCIATTAAYLKSYGSQFPLHHGQQTRLFLSANSSVICRVAGYKVPNIFFAPGDIKAGARTYQQFANQVLLAEREEDKIQVTMRRSQMPLDPMKTLEHEAQAPEQRPSYVLSVAWVFKALLAGIPDGILGSGALYQALVDISYGRTPRLSSDGEPKRPDSCLEGLSTWEHVKSKAIALAMLALTSKMHMELICAVFGLCSILLHDTQVLIDSEWLAKVRKRERRPSWAAGLLDVDRLSRVLGPLLTNQDEDDVYENEYGRIPNTLKGERVVRMLVEGWRGVSRQLRWWERCGCPPKRIVLREELNESQAGGKKEEEDDDDDKQDM